jgi:hypothetical protein
MKNLLKGVSMMVLLVGVLHSSQKIVRVNAISWDKVVASFRPVFGKNMPEVVAGRPGEWYDFLVNENEFSKMKLTGLKCDIIVEDFEKWKNLFRGQYHSYNEVVNILRNLANSNPGIAKLESIGPSYEGRWIYGLKISDNVGIDEDEPEQLFSGIHHSREWATVEVNLFIADSLLSAYGIDPNITQIVNSREIWVFPIINPDGYVYDYPSGNMWRKNRQPFHGYIGTDINRNYNGTCQESAVGGWGWVPSGASVTHYPSSEVFCGFKGFSAPEINSYSDFIKLRHFVSVIDFHSHGELVLGAWGHISDPAPHDNWYDAIGSAMASRIQRLGGGNYTYSSAYGLYPTSGGSLDWEYGWSNYSNGFPCIAFVNEVGTNFYQPTQDLDHIVRENFDGVFYLLQKGDSIRNYMTCWVPSPKIEPLDTVGSDFTLIWHPKNMETNDPIYWEIEEFQNPQPVTEDFESGTSLWNLETFALSSARSHSGNYSLYAGNDNNIQAQARTKYPYFVNSGDSLTFWTWHNLEDEYDVAIVEVSEDGRDWYPLVSERYNSQSGGWVRYAYSLDAWAGRSVYFRWRVMTDDYVLEEGFYIDDVYPVPDWGSIQTVATQVYDTLYNFSGYADGTYYFRTRGYNNQFGWGNWSGLEEVFVSSTKISEGKVPVDDFKILYKDGIKIIYSLRGKSPLSVSIYDMAGRKIKTYKLGKLTGSGKISLNPSLSKGIFIIKASIGKEKSSKILILK